MIAGQPQIVTKGMHGTSLESDIYIDYEVEVPNPRLYSAQLA